MKASNQCADVRRHLESGRTLSPKEALELYGIMRLAARVKDLREVGMDIVDLRKESKTRYSVYWLRTRGNGQGSLMPLSRKGRPE